MKKTVNNIMSYINYKYFSVFSYILLLFWAVTPIIEYALNNFLKIQYNLFFVFSIYIVGIAGILEYLLYIYKIHKDNHFDIKEYIPHIIIALLIFLALISSICAKDSHLSFLGESYRKEGFFIYLMYVGFVLSASIIIDKKYIKNIFKTIIFSALFITIIPLLKSDFTYLKFTNIYYNLNHYGYFLMISLMLSGFMFLCSTTKSKKALYLLIYIFLIHMLIQNNTFGCFLSIFLTLIFALVFSIIKKYKRLDVLILLVVFVLSSFIISHYNIKIGERINYDNKKDMILTNILSFSKDLKTLAGNNNEVNIDTIGTSRWLLWKEACNYIKTKPIIGGGMECLKEYYNEKEITMDRPHNVVLQVAAFIGIPGAILYLLLIIYLALVNLKNINKSAINYMVYCSAMCYFISSNFGNSMFYTSPYFMILIGLLIGMRYSKNNIITRK